VWFIYFNNFIFILIIFYNNQLVVIFQIQLEIYLFLSDDPDFCLHIVKINPIHDVTNLIVIEKKYT
jgi:hypothetical protein